MKTALLDFYGAIKHLYSVNNCTLYTIMFSCWILDVINQNFKMYVVPQYKCCLIFCYVYFIFVQILVSLEQSRRDDLESLGYILMYFNVGTLPWQGLKAATKRQKYERISEKKMSTPIELLCKGYPCKFCILNKINIY